MENEVWKNAYGFDGYEVSSLGHIRSKDRMIQYPTYHRKIAGRIMKQRKDSQGINGGIVVIFILKNVFYKHIN